VSHYLHQTRRGPVGIDTDGREITAVIVGSSRPSDSDPDPLALATARQIDEYYAGDRKKFDLPFTIGGTEFQKRVVIAVTRIPYGETRSYADVARAIGHPGASRAVGSVMAKNEMHLLVPCHRVVKSDGTSGLYGGGEEFKESLIAFERMHRGTDA
jgi:methylated-DNA-[protein]-cysteine S-methyltransferase